MRLVSSGSDWGPTEWCSALAEHFFCPESAQLPVLFFIDEALLAALHPSRDAGVAVTSLSEAVRRGLANPNPHGYFDGFERRGRQWKLAGARDCPPFLHLLALCVLAATRMGTGGVATSNYRHHICGLLDLSDAEMPAGFRDSLGYLWDTLTWWLDCHHRGDLGLSTIVEGKHFTHIGYPISQTLFRSVDNQRLDDFFRWIGLRAGEEIDDDVLVAHFRAWAPGNGLSDGALRVVGEPEFDATIRRILGRFSQTWDGTSSKAGGERRTALRVVISAFPRVSASAMAEQPDGFPDRLEGAFAGRTVSATADDGVYSLTGEIEGKMLSNGLDLGTAAARLVLDGSDVHVLELDAELGGWASVKAIRPGARHWLLVSPAHAKDVLAQLDQCAQVCGAIGPGPAALREWTMVRNVVFDGAASLSGALSVRRPTHSNRLALRGGLPLGAANAYLAGGAPDLWLPAVPQNETGPIPQLDGTPLDARSEQIRLADVLPSSDSSSHVVQWAGTRRSFTTVASALRAPESDAVPAHGLDVDEHNRACAHHPPSVNPLGSVRVQGAIVDGLTVPSRPAPVLLKRGAQSAWLLGAQPGQIREITAPRTPSWHRRIGLADQLFEARAEFEVAWVVERWRFEPQLRIRRIVDLMPDRERCESVESLALWAGLLHEATLNGADEQVSVRLEQYRAVAHELSGEAEPA